MATHLFPAPAGLSAKPDGSEFATFEHARYRRTRHSSSESGEAGEFLVSVVKGRVGAPPPRPLPVQSGWNTQCQLIRDVLGCDLENQTTEIIESEGITSEEVELVSRFVSGNQVQGQPTIFIMAKWDEDAPVVWERIVKNAKKYADWKSLGSEKLAHLDIAVEMVNVELTWDKFVSVIPSGELTPSLARDWVYISDKVVQILESYQATRSKVTTIALFKLGFLQGPRNPLTVYVSVSYESEEGKWPPVVSEIQRYLDTFPHKLRLHLEHNTSESYPTFPLLRRNMSAQEWSDKKIRFNFDPDRKYKSQVGLGDDIGPARYLSKDDGEEAFPGVGTLGCWVEIKSKTNTQWTKYALTNYHVLRPAIDGFQIGVHPMDSTATVPAAPKRDSDLWRSDLHGVYPNTRFASAPALIEHPTRAKHNFAVQYLSRQVETNPEGPTVITEKEHLDTIVAFFDNSEQLFGTIYCTSGYRRRSANNGRFDWALVKPVDLRRVGHNTLPTRQDWHQKVVYMNLPKLDTMGKSLQQPPANGLRSTLNGGNIFKVGASTGPTVGKFSHVKSRVAILEDKHMKNDMGGDQYMSEEFMYIGDPNTEYVAYHGDSGSVAFNVEGQAVGMVFRGQRAQQATTSFAYITPIEDVFADIKAFSKNAITDIRIAQD